MEISEVSLNKAEKDALRRDPQTKVIAPPMPLKLIEGFPVDTANNADISSASNTRGVDAVGAAQSSFTGSGITVAALEAGIELTHSAFIGANISCKNFTTESNDDIHGHGTHCAGTIFGQDVGGIRIGVARIVSSALIEARNAFANGALAVAASGNESTGPPGYGNGIFLLTS